MAANYQHCRKCRTKLKGEFETARLAFCSKGCWFTFYATHCRVCEKELPAKTHRGRVNLCSRNCKNIYLKRRPIFNTYSVLQDTGRSNLPSRRPVDQKQAIIAGTKTGDISVPPPKSPAPLKPRVDADTWAAIREAELGIPQPEAIVTHEPKPAQQDHTGEFPELPDCLRRRA